ncbi:MAG TPA: CRISPR-associated helicase Cas3' [Nitrospirae bacterium]|nr:CRISPR-associated helicase Cas3' [Nitrospirota bacterium]HDZ00566.1 CRISPR-associated helicase Cas3' [Nitrospirota bacterium]
MISLKSHPDRQLLEHIAQIKAAVDSLCRWHSEEAVSHKIMSLIQKVVSLHDAGKATKAFQEYIENPSAYTGDPMDKAHTPMSTLLTLLLSEYEGCNLLDTIIIAAVVFGHHRELPSAERLREIGSGIIPKILKRQIATLQAEGLKAHCGIDISGLELETRPWARAKRYLDNYILPEFEKLSIENAVRLRLKAQMLFSILLEADKAYLAVKEAEEYLKREPRCWMSQWVVQKIGSQDNSMVNRIRQSIRSDLDKKIDAIGISGIYSLTAPTGSGKTLLAATWLLKMREKIGKLNGRVYPKAIIVLPFLSVIDQTTKEYESLLKIGGEDVDGSWFLTSHSLSDRKYKKGMEEETENFFVDTWRTELVITTYDQFLMTLMSPKTRYQMRFHNLFDCLIVMDEVQSLPCKLWKPLEGIMKQLVTVGNTSVLLMSATLPSVVADATPLIENYSSYFKAFNRYLLKFRVQQKLMINDFCNEVFERRNKWLEEKKRVLITLNTRRSTRAVRDKLDEKWPEKFSSVPLFFLSADVTPKDRLAIIDTIKEGKPCIVVSTQCIEAGVDIDMDTVIRDFAPFDSLVQIAGRCNRNGRSMQPASIEIVDLVNEQGKRYADMIYDDVHLQSTRQLIDKRPEIKENEILPVADRFFEALSRKKDTGTKHLERFARWVQDEPVRELLRGKEKKKYTFLVIEQDMELKNEMLKANAIENRWKRREAWRAIAGRIANISISVFAKLGFNPQYIADEYLGQWILRDKVYSTGRGLVLDDHLDNGMYIF